MIFCEISHEEFFSFTAQDVGEHSIMPANYEKKIFWRYDEMLPEFFIFLFFNFQFFQFINFCIYNIISLYNNSD